MKEPVNIPANAYGRALLSALNPDAGDAHPQPEQLSAFAQKALGKKERAAVLRHLSLCADCRVSAYASADCETAATVRASLSQAPVWRWAWTTVLAGATFSLVFLIHHDLEMPPSEEEIRPVAARVSPKPFVEPKSSAVQTARKRQTIPAMPEPPVVVPRRALIPGPLSVAQLNPAPPKLMFLAGAMGGQSAGKRVTGSAFLPAAGLEKQTNLENSMASINIASVNKENWNIDSRGQLQRLSSRGMQQVSLDGLDPFTAVGSLGQDVWAGRADASLYHSDDGGTSWKRIYIQSAEGGPMAPISSIQVISPTFVDVGTRNGERWTTSDAGNHWRKK